MAVLVMLIEALIGRGQYAAIAHRTPDHVVGVALPIMLDGQVARGELLLLVAALHHAMHAHRVLPFAIAVSGAEHFQFEDVERLLAGVTARARKVIFVGVSAFGCLVLHPKRRWGRGECKNMFTSTSSGDRLNNQRNLLNRSLLGAKQ